VISDSKLIYTVKKVFHVPYHYYNYSGHIPKIPAP
jgi:hypothetical protein